MRIFNVIVIVAFVPWETEAHAKTISLEDFYAIVIQLIHNLFFVCVMFLWPKALGQWDYIKAFA